MDRFLVHPRRGELHHAGRRAESVRHLRDARRRHGRTPRHRQPVRRQPLMAARRNRLDLLPNHRAGPPHHQRAAPQRRRLVTDRVRRSCNGCAARAHVGPRQKMVAARARPRSRGVLRAGNRRRHRGDRWSAGRARRVRQSLVVAGRPQHGFSSRDRHALAAVPHVVQQGSGLRARTHRHPSVVGAGRQALRSEQRTGRYSEERHLDRGTRRLESHGGVHAFHRERACADVVADRRSARVRARRILPRRVRPQRGARRAAPWRGHRDRRRGRQRLSAAHARWQPRLPELGAWTGSASSTECSAPRARVS